MMIDPSGLYASLDTSEKSTIPEYDATHTTKYVDKIIEYFNGISDDEISYDEKNNRFIISKECNDGNHPIGPSLVRDLLNNKEINIEFKYLENSSDTSSQTQEQLSRSKKIVISLDPDKDFANCNEANYIENADGVPLIETDPNRNIVFAHELCHAYDCIEGNFDPYEDDVWALYYDVGGTLRVSLTNRCEIRVIGLDYLTLDGKIHRNPNKYTENMIRMEIDGTKRTAVAMPKK